MRMQIFPQAPITGSKGSTFSLSPVPHMDLIMTAEGFDFVLTMVSAFISQERGMKTSFKVA
jgi:hypothetical protein